MANTSSIRITELRRLGAGVLEETPVVFAWDSRTHSMPQESLDYELKINTVRELDPLSEEIVEQVMGPEWTPFEMHGEWLDKWAGQGFAEDTEREFARLVGRTPLVRVQLDRRSFVGLITNLKIRYRTAGEIGYTLTFSPHTNENVGTFRRSPSTAPTSHPVDSRLAELDDLLSGQLDAHDLAVADVPAKTNDIEATKDGLATLGIELDRARAANDAIAFDAEDGADLLTLADRTHARLLSLASSFSRVAGAADGLSLEVAVLAASDVVAYNDVVGALAFEEWSRNAYCDAQLTAAASRAAASDARARAAQSPLTVHLVKKGDTLFRISAKYYGTPNSWRVIYNANDLDSISLVAGSQLIIPERQR